MIKEKEIIVKWSYQNRKHFEDLGYCYTKNGDSFSVLPEEMTSGSNVKITAICDLCGKEKIIKYQDYYKSIKSHGIYTCAKCSHLKTKLTCLDKYGGISPLSNSQVIKKREESNLNKYGVANPFNKNAPDEIKTKIKETMLNKYGVENIFQNTNYIQQKTIEKYGVPQHFMLESQKEKYLYGKKNHNYNHNLSPEYRVNRRTLPEHTKWRNEVYKRDNYTCKICGYNKGHILEAHHIFSYKAYPEHRFNIHNGITLCKECHKKFHDMYGYGNNTLTQFILFFLHMIVEGQTTIPQGSTPEDELPVEAQNILKEDDDIVYST